MKILNLNIERLDKLVDEHGINLVAIVDPETDEIIDDYDVGSPEFAERAEWFVKGEYTIEDKERPVEGQMRMIKVLKCARIEPTFELSVNPVTVETEEPAKDLVEYPLPEDPEAQRKALIDLEDNVGVIIEIKDDKAIVSPYKKDPALADLEKIVSCFVFHKPSMKWTAKDVRVMDIGRYSQACLDSMRIAEPNTTDQDLGILVVDWESKNIKLEQMRPTATE